MQEIAALVKKGNVVAFCGAGFSQESGIPTFRGKSGLWERYDPDLYARLEGFRSLLLSHHKKLKKFVIDMYRMFLDAEPNYAHYALKELEERGVLLGIITQNVDDFHFQVGSKNVAEVHGNAYMFRCRNCNFSVKKKKEEAREFLDRLSEREASQEILREIFQFMGDCPECEGSLEPGIVFFGESLPPEEIQKSYKYLEKAKVVLCVGTSGAVYPAASIPLEAKQRGAKIIVVNFQESSFVDIADFILYTKATEFFKNLLFHL